MSHLSDLEAFRTLYLSPPDRAHVIETATGTKNKQNISLELIISSTESHFALSIGDHPSCKIPLASLADLVALKAPSLLDGPALRAQIESFTESFQLNSGAFTSLWGSLWLSKVTISLERDAGAFTLKVKFADRSAPPAKIQIPLDASVTSNGLGRGEPPLLAAMTALPDALAFIKDKDPAFFAMAEQGELKTESLDSNPLTLTSRKRQRGI